MAKKIRGVLFEENENNAMGLSFYNLSHRFGYQSPNWPYFEDVKIERIHYMAKSGVLSQRITTSMHNTTHIDAPAHVVQGTPFIDEVPLPHFFGSGIVIALPKQKWESITYDDLEKAAGKTVRPRDVVIVNTGWHKKYDDSEDYFCYSPGFVPSAGEWFVEKQVNKVNKRKEFFQVRLKELKEVVDELSIEGTWTMECEASEYRETVALEASMRSNVNVRNKWLADQAAFNFEADDFEDAEQEFEQAEA